MRFLKPEQIQRAAKERIFREMARGQIDYGQFGKYYLDGKFLFFEFLNAFILTN